MEENQENRKDSDVQKELEETQRELQKIVDYKKEEREKHERKQRARIEKERQKEKQRISREFENERKIEEGVSQNKFVQVPMKSGTLYIEKWIVWLVVCFFIAVLFFGIFTVVFGFGVFDGKFQTTVEPANCTNICPANPTCPSCPACPSLNCGNVTYNLTFTPDIDVHLNSS